MKKTKLLARFMTLFLFLLFGIAIGAKSAGLDTFSFGITLGALGILSLLHIHMLRKMFAPFHNASAA